MAPGPLATVVQPKGLALATLVLTVFLFCTSIVTVLTRTWVRVSDRCFGLDDGLMLAGLVCGCRALEQWFHSIRFLLCTQLTSDVDLVHGRLRCCRSCYLHWPRHPRRRAESGHDHGGDEGALLRSAWLLWCSSSHTGLSQFVVLWQVFYVTALCCIKSAICVTLTRIATERFHRIIAVSIIVVTCATSLIGFIGVLTTCQPVAANWDPARGHCASPTVITDLSYLVSASSILTDWSAAVLPIVILWKAQMKTSVKLSVGVILGLGAV